MPGEKGPLVVLSVARASDRSLGMGASQTRAALSSKSSCLREEYGRLGASWKEMSLPVDLGWGLSKQFLTRQYIWESGAGGSFTVQKAGVHVAIMWSFSFFELGSFFTGR